MKALGEQHRIDEFTQPQVPLGEITSHIFALIASGVCRADAYFRGPYVGGAAFLLFKAGTLPSNPVSPLIRITRVLPEAISSLEIPNHKLAFLGYLDSSHLVGEAEGNTVVVKEDGKLVLTATFDERQRSDRTGGHGGGREGVVVVLDHRESLEAQERMSFEAMHSRFLHCFLCLQVSCKKESQGL